MSICFNALSCNFHTIFQLTYFIPHMFKSLKTVLTQIVTCLFIILPRQVQMVFGLHTHILSSTKQSNLLLASFSAVSPYPFRRRLSFQTMTSERLSSSFILIHGTLSSAFYVCRQACKILHYFLGTPLMTSPHWTNYYSQRLPLKPVKAFPKFRHESPCLPGICNTG